MKDGKFLQGQYFKKIGNLKHVGLNFTLQNLSFWARVNNNSIIIDITKESL